MRGRDIIAALIIGTVAAASGIARAQLPDTRKDEEAIHAIISATTDAFSKHDAKAWVQHCTSDAELVTVRGESMKGVAQIEKGLATIFQTRGRHVTLKTLEVSVRFVRPDVALAHVKNELSGLVSPDGQTLPPHQELSVRVRQERRDVAHHCVSQHHPAALARVNAT